MAGSSPALRRRDEALAFIIERIARTGTSPSLEEIGRGLTPRVCKSRARQLVRQLIADGLVEHTAGSQRDLVVRDVAHCRDVLDIAARNLGWSTATPMGTLKPSTQVQLPILPPFEHYPLDF